MTDTPPNPWRPPAADDIAEHAKEHSAEHSYPDAAAVRKQEALSHDPSWQDETLKLAYEIAIKAHSVSADAIGALDAKLVTLCTVATALLGLSGTLLKPSDRPASVNCWLIAVALWLLALGTALRTLRARDIEVSNPAKLNDARWLAQPTAADRYYVIRDLGVAFELNLAVAKEKAFGVMLTMVFTGGEMLALVVSRLLVNL